MNLNLPEWGSGRKTRVFHVRQDVETKLWNKILLSLQISEEQGVFYQKHSYFAPRIIVTPVPLE